MSGKHIQTTVHGVNTTGGQRVRCVLVTDVLLAAATGLAVASNPLNVHIAVSLPCISLFLWQSCEPCWAQYTCRTREKFRNRRTPRIVNCRPSPFVSPYVRGAQSNLNWLISVSHSNSSERVPTHEDVLQSSTSDSCIARLSSAGFRSQHSVHNSGRSPCLVCRISVGPAAQAL